MWHCNCNYVKVTKEVDIALGLSVLVHIGGALCACVGYDSTTSVILCWRTTVRVEFLATPPLNISSPPDCLKAGAGSAYRYHLVILVFLQLFQTLLHSGLPLKCGPL